MDSANQNVAVKVFVSSVFGCMLFACFLPMNLMGQSATPAVFVTNNVGDSVSSFSVNPDGSLNLVGSFDAGDSPQSISLSPNGRYLAVTHATESTTTELAIVYVVNSDASLTQIYDLQVPDSPLNCAWLSDSILSITRTSLSVDNQIITYEWDESAISLVQVDMQFTGLFNTSLDASLDRSLVFANDSFGNRIFSFGFDAFGMLTLNDAQSTGSIFPVAIKTSPDGNFVYGAGGISGTGNEILAFAVDGLGAMSPIAGAQSPGESPKVIGITGDGSVLVAGHGSDGTVRSFVRDTATGLLTPTNFSYDVGGQGELGDLRVVGDLMFVTDESTSGDGQRGLLSFAINPDGSFTQNGPIVDAGESRPEFIATWEGAAEQFVSPDNYEIFRGVLVGGDFFDLLESDDFYTCLNPGFTINTEEAPVWLVFNGTIIQTPSSMEVSVESQAGTPGLTFSVDVFNWITQEYDAIGSESETFNTDSVVSFDVSSGVSNYVTPASGQTRARVGWRKTGFTINFPWEVRVDQFGWAVN